MANYVLSDEALYALLIGRHKDKQESEHVKFQEWAKKHTSEDYYFASRMSVARLAAGIERIDSAMKRDSTRAKLNSELISQFKDSLLEVDESVLKHWSALRASANDADPERLSSEQLIEIATAMHTGYTYVASLTETLKTVQQNVDGLSVEDPWI